MTTPQRGSAAKTETHNAKATSNQLRKTSEQGTGMRGRNQGILSPPSLCRPAREAEATRKTRRKLSQVERYYLYLIMGQPGMEMAMDNGSKGLKVSNMAHAMDAVSPQAV